jgi:cytochrome c biogenesis protein CcdA
MQPGRVLAFSVVATALMGLAVFAGLGAPHAPTAEATSLLPAATLGTVIVAALVDGINPCAFTVLLLFITALLASAQGRSPEDTASLRSRVVGLGSIYIASVFLTYLALGVGLLSTAAIFTQRHLPARLGAVTAVALGLWMLKDYFVPELGFRLGAPAAVSRWARSSAHRASVPALITGGILIGLCTLPCSGAMYLAVLSLLAMQTTALAGFGYLVLYNALFVLPLVIILLLASARPMLNRLAHWNLHHRERVRLAIGTGVVVMGFAILITI